MRELHGVVNLRDSDDVYGLKGTALMFDKLHVMPFSFDEFNEYFEDQYLGPEYSFLKSSGFAQTIPLERSIEMGGILNDPGSHDFGVEKTHFQFAADTWHHDIRRGIQTNSLDAADDLWVRLMAVDLGKFQAGDCVPICRLSPFGINTGQAECSIKEVIALSMRDFPMPGETCSWQDIMDFKAEAHDKLWTFRRFMHDLAVKQQTEAEVRDDLEWSLNEYSKAMEIHEMKSGTGFFEVYVIPTLEALENIAKFNWSKVAKGAVKAKARSVELREAERKAPGCEVAYVYDVRKRFRLKRAY
jgi:hypothetical protein